MSESSGELPGAPSFIRLQSHGDSWQTICKVKTPPSGTHMLFTTSSLQHTETRGYNDCTACRIMRRRSICICAVNVWLTLSLRWFTATEQSVQSDWSWVSTRLKVARNGKLLQVSWNSNICLRASKLWLLICCLGSVQLKMFIHCLIFSHDYT